MSVKLVKMCATNYDSYGKDLKLLGIQWMEKFQNEPDDLMETAVISCIDYCKKFPTIADIKEAIRDLQYDSSTQPKQLAYEVKRNESLHQKIIDMATGKTDTKEYLASIDVTDLWEYAKQYFHDITEKTVRDNIPELYQGQESQDACFACRINSVNDCYNQGFVVKHWMYKTGRIKNEMLKCQKNQKG